MRSAMTAVVGIVGLLAILAGFLFFGEAMYTPSKYVKTDNAIVNTSIQTEAAVQALEGIGAFVFALLCEVSTAVITFEGMLRERWKEEDRRAGQQPAADQLAVNGTGFSAKLGQL